MTAEAAVIKDPTVNFYQTGGRSPFFRCSSSPTEFSFQHKRSPALSKAPYFIPIFVLAQLGN
jgi:hypothetical protein